MFLATGTACQAEGMESAAIYSKCVVSLRKDYAQVVQPECLVLASIVMDEKGCGEFRFLQDIRAEF